MRYTMREPCDACPFRRRSGFKFARLKEFASGEFVCHKTATEEDDGDGTGTTFQAKPGQKSLHCAGALIFNEKRGEPTQMMRIAARLRMYDHTKLDMLADIGSKPSDYAMKRKTK